MAVVKSACRPLEPDLRVVMERVSEVAKLFEGRWMLHSLKRIDAALWERFCCQKSDYEAALVQGDADEVEDEAAAMIRGWQAVTARMIDANEPDDAYQLGVDPKTGTRVVIGWSPHSQAVVGDGAVWLSPHEVAALFGGLERIAAVRAVKAAFPGDEITKVNDTGFSDDL